MYIADDPTLALIARFVGDAEHLELADAEFLLRQVKAIEQYVRQFPVEEQKARALEWIASNAQQYRRQWQKNAVVQTLTQTRCPDCPLTGGHRSSPCEIHALWLKLLHHYTADEVSAQEYVENTLKLLGEYKNRLKIGRARKRPRLETA